MNRTLALLLALVAAVSYALWDSHSRGVAEGRAAVLAERVAPLVHRVRVTDTLYLRDTLRFTRWRERWDSVRITDTVTIAEVVYVPRADADSVLSACYAVLRSCEARVAARDTLIQSLKAALKAEQSAGPSRVRVVLDRAAWAAVGLGAGAVLFTRR